MVNGGFPPIKLVEKDKEKYNESKERFFSNVTKRTLDIRQLLTENTQKKSIIDMNEKKMYLYVLCEVLNADLTPHSTNTYHILNSNEFYRPNTI